MHFTGLSFDVTNDLCFHKDGVCAVDNMLKQLRDLFNNKHCFPPFEIPADKKTDRLIVRSETDRTDAHSSLNLRCKLAELLNTCQSFSWQKHKTGTGKICGFKTFAFSKTTPCLIISLENSHSHYTYILFCFLNILQKRKKSRVLQIDRQIDIVGVHLIVCRGRLQWCLRKAKHHTACFFPDGEKDGGDAAASAESSRFSGVFIGSRDSGVIS